MADALTSTILVVDDETLLRNLVVDMLGGDGYRILEAGDAAAALSVMSSHPEVDLLFTDVNMPGSLDGLGLAAEVSRLWPKVALIVTSGRERLDAHSLPDRGTFLPKPYRAAQLLDLVACKIGHVGGEAHV